MKRHPRSMVVEKARTEFTQAFLDIEKKHELTFGEMYLLLGERIERLSRDLVQTERHPDNPDKNGDVA